MVIVAPARDVAVTSQCQRMTTTRSDCDEVARNDGPLGVVAPTRDAAVTLQRERVPCTRCNRDEVAVDAVGRCLVLGVASPAIDTSIYSQR